MRNVLFGPVYGKESSACLQLVIDTSLVLVEMSPSEQTRNIISAYLKINN